jgi:hypothetical protein
MAGPGKASTGHCAKRSPVCWSSSATVQMGPLDVTRSLGKGGDKKQKKESFFFFFSFFWKKKRKKEREKKNMNKSTLQFVFYRVVHAGLSRPQSSAR